MPEPFDKCRAQGGKIRTTKPTPDTYLPICYIGGKSYRGEVHQVKSNNSPTAQAIQKRMRG